MRELSNQEFKRIIHLLNNEHVHCTFAYSVIEERQPGRIFVDDPINPSSCLICCKSGKYLVCGNTDNDTFNEFLDDYLYNRKNHGRYFDLYSSSKAWTKKLNKILFDNAAKLSRQLFNLDYSNLDSLSKCELLLPDHFELRRMDEDLFIKYANEIDDSYFNLWGTAENFIRNGFGFCILKDNEFVSVCNTYYVKDSSAEIDIITLNGFRNQGFAVMTCTAFIKHCIEHNINPIWDCDNGNKESKNLAKKLGFKSVETYEMFWWHENKRFVDIYLNNYNYTT